MEDIYTVYKGVLFEDSIRNYVGKDNVSICRLLHSLNIDDIAQHVEKTYYSNKDWHFRYRISSIIKLTIVKFFRELPFDKVVSSLTDEEALLLHFINKDGDIALPTGSTLHHFIKYRLGEAGLQHVMGMITERIIRHTKYRDLKTDSTPLEASRYDKHSDYNPHYNCKMDKAHITMIGTFPLYMTYTNGLAHDSPELKKHIDFLKNYGLNAESYALDTGYDSFENYADVWYHLNVIPTIPPRCDAVINKEGTIGRINHWVNKMWKKGGSIHMPIDKKLELLYENGREKQVGMYLRNQAMNDEMFEEKRKKRQTIERSNGHTKSVVTFDVRKIQKKSRELYTIGRFVAYQLLMLANLQNGIEKINLAQYF
jgi:uncharacterized protein Usg